MALELRERESKAHEGLPSRTGSLGFLVVGVLGVPGGESSEEAGEVRRGQIMGLIRREGPAWPDHPYFQYNYE